MRHPLGIAVVMAWALGALAPAPALLAQAARPAPDSGAAPPAGAPPQASPQSPAAAPEAQPQTSPQAPATAPSSQTPPAQTPPAPETTVLDKREIQGVLGKDVIDASGKNMGRIVNVIVDRAGQPRAAVIDFGGFLGVGSRKIAVDWNALHFEPNDKSGKITLDLTQNQVKAAPEYQEGKPVVVLGASGATQPLPDYR
jgi:hypothetical protein